MFHNIGVFLTSSCVCGSTPVLLSASKCSSPTTMRSFSGIRVMITGHRLGVISSMLTYNTNYNPRCMEFKLVRLNFVHFQGAAVRMSEDSGVPGHESFIDLCQDGCLCPESPAVSVSSGGHSPNMWPQPPMTNSESSMEYLCRWMSNEISKDISRISCIFKEHRDWCWFSSRCI